MTNKLLFFVLLALCFSGCDMLETHPYDVHITGERELNNKNIQLIENKMQGRVPKMLKNGHSHFPLRNQLAGFQTECFTHDINIRMVLNWVIWIVRHVHCALLIQRFDGAGHFV